MSGSCHLDRASNVEIGVECQIFIIYLVQLIELPILQIPNILFVYFLSTFSR